MNKILTTIVVGAMIAFAGSALADESDGTIGMIDPATNTLTLEDGTVYQLSENVVIQDLKPGQEVTVSYEIKDGKNMAEKVTVK